MRVVGISAAHDGSVAVYCDGKIEFFCKEERLTRKKRDKRPYSAMYEALKFLNGKKVDAVALSSPHGTAVDPTLEILVDISKKMFKTQEVHQLFLSHHLCHANLAFYNSGFEKAVVVVVDRNGSDHPESRGLMFETESVFTAEYPGKFTEINKNYMTLARGESADPTIMSIVLSENKKKPHCVTKCNSLYGITKVYETATVLIGQDIMENGKTMGLAAYGSKMDPSPMFFVSDGTSNDSLFFYSLYKDYYDKKIKSLTKENHKLYADYAHEVQTQTQEQVLKLIKSAVERTGIKNVCVTGGYGLNVVANGYYISQMPDVNFFFEPLADDTGNSIGAAMRVYREITKDTKIYPLKDTFFNGHQPSLDVENLSKTMTPFIHTKEIETKEVAQMLVENKKVAVFSGKSEAGPRALGNRSILFYPVLQDSKDIVNKIKKREWYRPFAACVLKEDANQYFNMMNIKDSPYMTVSFDCLEHTKELFPGIVHVDGSCRVQTVDEDNKNLYALLSELKKITGHGLLLNTSFNGAGDPLVETLSEAVDFLLKSQLDCIWTPDNGKIIFKR